MLASLGPRVIEVKAGPFAPYEPLPEYRNIAPQLRETPELARSPEYPHTTAPKGVIFGGGQTHRPTVAVTVTRLDPPPPIG